jgi:hypothetical protein
MPFKHLIQSLFEQVLRITGLATKEAQLVAEAFEPSVSIIKNYLALAPNIDTANQAAQELHLEVFYQSRDLLKAVSEGTTDKSAELKDILVLLFSPTENCFLRIRIEVIMYAVSIFDSETDLWQPITELLYELPSVLLTLRIDDVERVLKILRMVTEKLSFCDLLLQNDELLTQILNYGLCPSRKLVQLCYNIALSMLTNFSKNECQPQIEALLAHNEH